MHCYDTANDCSHRTSKEASYAGRDSAGVTKTRPPGCNLCRAVGLGRDWGSAAGRLARIAAVLHQLSYIASARISSEPVYELKAAYARMAHEDILHYAARVLDYQLGDFLRDALFTLFSAGTVELATAFARPTLDARRRQGRAMVEETLRFLRGEGLRYQILYASS